MAGFGTWGVASVMAAWCLLAVGFFGRRWTTGAPSQKREPVAWAGTALQAAAFFCIWGFRREPAGSPLIQGHPMLNATVVAACVALAWTCAGLMFWAIRTLGRQWAVGARLVEGHELVIAGPYRFVRNPIYSGLFGLGMATAGVLSQPWTIAAGAPLFLAGTMVRVRAEERLLRERFGARYDEFALRVPALLPRLKP